MKRIGLFLGALLVACGVPTFILQEYDGPVRDRDLVANVRFEGKGTVDLVQIDGSVADARVPEDARLHVELLPGKHLLMVANRETPNESPKRVVFVAEAGRTYQVVFVRASMEAWNALPRVFEIDSKSGAQLKDATFVPPPRVAPPPRPSAAPVAPPAPLVSAAPEAPENQGAAGAHGE